MGDTNPAGQNLLAPLPSGQAPQNQPPQSKKKYLAVLAALLIIAVGLGAYFMVGGELFKGFVGEKKIAVEESGGEDDGPPVLKLSVVKDDTGEDDAPPTLEKVFIKDVAGEDDEPPTLQDIPDEDDEPIEVEEKILREEITADEAVGGGGGGGGGGGNNNSGEVMATVDVPESELADTIIEANSCLAKSPDNKITTLEDIKTDHPANAMLETLRKLAYNGNPIIVGRKVGDKYYFETDKPILRPEFFKLAAWPSCLAQAASSKGLWDISRIKNFKDQEFDKNFWAYEIVNALTKLNIVQGYDDGTVGLSKNITRAEIIKLLLDAYALRIYFDQHEDIDFPSYDKDAVLQEVFADSFSRYDSSPFPDISELNKPWFYDYALISYDLNITKGIEGSFNGDKSATRLEAATMVYNFFIANIEKQR